MPLLKSVSLDGALGDRVREFDFLELSKNQRLGRKFVLGNGPYPSFEVAEGEQERLG